MAGLVPAQDDSIDWSEPVPFESLACYQDGMIWLIDFIAEPGLLEWLAWYQEGMIWLIDFIAVPGLLNGWPGTRKGGFDWLILLQSLVY